MTLSSVPPVFFLSGVSDALESLGNLAKGTLLSHDVISNDLSWTTPDLIVCLNLYVGVWQQHRSEIVQWQDSKETLDAMGIFKVSRFARTNHIFRQFLLVCPETSHCSILCFWLQVPVDTTALLSRNLVWVTMIPFQTGTPLTCRRPCCDSPFNRLTS